MNLNGGVNAPTRLGIELRQALACTGRCACDQRALGCAGNLPGILGMQHGIAGGLQPELGKQLAFLMCQAHVSYLP